MSIDISYLELSGHLWGSCYYFNEKGDVVCSEGLQSKCYNYFKSNQICDTGSIPKLNKYKNDFWVSDPTTAAALSGKNIGDMLWGGVYGGIYTPADISLNDGIGNVITSTDTTQHAMIIYPYTLNLSYLRPNIKLIPRTSNFNGKYNLVMKNSKNVPLNNDNTFKNWHLASFCELEYIRRKLQKHMKLKRALPDIKKKSKLSSSSVFNIPDPTELQKLNPFNKKYLRGLDMEYEYPFLINPYNRSDFLAISLIEVI